MEEREAESETETRATIDRIWRPKRQLLPFDRERVHEELAGRVATMG